MFVDSPEIAAAHSKFRKFDYMPDEFRTYFVTPFEQYKSRIGQEFTVLSHDVATEKQIVDDGGEPEPVYKIRFVDKQIITAWAYEVCQLNVANCK